MLKIFQHVTLKCHIHLKHSIGDIDDCEKTLLASPEHLTLPLEPSYFQSRNDGEKKDSSPSRKRGLPASSIPRRPPLFSIRNPEKKERSKK